MVFSPLTARTVAHHNKMHDRRGASIERVIIHHWAGLKGGDSRLLNPREQVSATYILYSDGTLVGQVPEENRPWTSGGWNADHNAITVEIQNSGGQVNGNNDDPSSWAISAKAWTKLILLLADIAKRYKWANLSGARVRGHREFQATACPGGYLWSRMGQIRTEATKAMGGTAPAPAPKPAPSKGKKSVAQMADEVMAGVHGNGHANRQKSLGVNAATYQRVRDEVNRRLYGTAPAAKKPAGKSVATMATEVINGHHGNGHANRQKSLGVNAATYAQVRAEVNRRVSGAAPAKPAGKSVAQMATEVIQGKHGNGHANRQRSLGVNNATYQAVRAEVNRRV